MKAVKNILNRFRRKNLISALLTVLLLSGMALPLTAYAEAGLTDGGSEAGSQEKEGSGVLEVTSEASPPDGLELRPEQRSDWENRLLLLLNEYNVDPAAVTAGYVNFETGEEHLFHGEEYRIAGSMYKVPLNMLFLDWIEEGELTLNGRIGEYNYSELLKGTVIYSNNDYAKILWDYAGATIQTEPASTLYHRYRILIAPLMGEDPDNVDEKYYENNFFTARQMLHCLKVLYDGGEKYAPLIEAMQAAEPQKYFRLRERRFEIAHKYGWFADGDTLYLNDCAICFTEDPIAIVLFTTGDGSDSQYRLLGAFSSLMCDYAQETRAERLAAEQRALQEQEALAGQQQAEQGSAAGTGTGASGNGHPDTAIDGRESVGPAEETGSNQSVGIGNPQKPGSVAPDGNAEGWRWKLSAGETAAAALSLAAGIGGMLLLGRQRRNGVRMGHSVVGMLVMTAGLLLCIPGQREEKLILADPGDPREAAQAFFRELAAEPSDIGIDVGQEENTDSVNGAVRNALRESRSFTPEGEASVDRTAAAVPGRLRTLDLTLMGADLQRQIREELLKLGETRPRSEIYDEDGNTRREVAEEAYDLAMLSLLEHAEDYTAEVRVTLQLALTGDGWQVQADRELNRLLCGNLA